MKNNLPLISVIIPTYKRKSDLITRSINSVLNQSYQNLELIIVDDSPDDYQYREEVENFVNSLSDSRIKYIKHPKNLGANIARNTGIKLSNGEYCAFLDDDDEWHKDKLMLQYKELVTSNSDLVYCKAIVINEYRKTFAPLPFVLKKGNIFNDLLYRNIVGSNSFILINKKTLEDIGLYDENMQSLQDWDLFIRISKKYRISFVDKFLVFYHIHEGERITTNPKKQLQGWNILFEKYDTLLKENKDVKNVWKIKLIPVYIKNGLYHKALSLIIECLLHSPTKFFSYVFSTIKYNIDKPRTELFNKEDEIYNKL